MTNPEKLDAIAEIFDASKDFDGVLAHFGYELLRKRLTGGRTLEMGCSSGVMTALLAPDVACLEVVDGSARYVEEVQRRLGRPDVKFHLSLFENFRPSEPYDDVVLARGLEHVRDARELLATVRGWLRPSGSLHVIVPNAWSFHRLVGVEMGLLADPHELSARDRMLDHQRVYDPVTLRRDLEGAGFRVAELSGNVLKFLPNSGMATLSPELIRGFFRLGLRFPDHCAEIYARARPDAPGQ